MFVSTFRTMLEKSTREKREILGRLLAAQRKNLGISQPVAAERLGVTKGAYQAWESGKTMPDTERHPVISLFLGLRTTSELWQMLEGTVEEESWPGRDFDTAVQAVNSLPENKLRELNLVIAQKLIGAS
jgi:transcriptional regulator with XRE-family HTH domain